MTPNSVFQGRVGCSGASMSSYNSSSVWRGDAEEQEVVNSNATGMQISFLGTAGTLTTRTRSPTTTFFILLLIIFIIVIIIIRYSGSLTTRTRSALSFLYYSYSLSISLFLLLFLLILLSTQLLASLASSVTVVIDYWYCYRATSMHCWHFALA